MKTFKSRSDLEKLTPDDPALPVMEELVQVLIDDFTEPGHRFEHPCMADSSIDSKGKKDEISASSFDRI